jgi:hypothetical protein
MRDLIQRLGILCRGEANLIYPWLQERETGWLWFCCAIIVVGSSVYGASVGVWQHPVQGLYAAIKFPLLIFGTVLGNAALNGMLAQVLGLPLTFRQSLLAILMSFVIVTLFLAALTPVSLFLAYSAPPPSSAARQSAYSVILLTHVAVIAYAGVLANVRLFRLLEKCNGSRARAVRLLFAWLAGNLFFGTQLSWIISPFIGDPDRPLMFIQDRILEQNFFEYAWERLLELLR